jgi:preprotein translocase subunit SecE
MNISTYLNETKGELKHVNWPSRRQTINYTIVVIGISLAVALVLSFFDLIFSVLLKFII